MSFVPKCESAAFVHHVSCNTYLTASIDRYAHCVVYVWMYNGYRKENMNMSTAHGTLLKM